MPSLSSFPTYPLPGMVRVTASATGGGNWIRVWCTNAPPGSKLRAAIDNSALGRVEVFAADPGTGRNVELDRSGVYTFAVQEYTRGGSATGGGYQGAPEGDPLETKIGAEATERVFVMTRVELQIGPSQHRATLVLYVANTTIRPTTMAEHKVLSPALTLPSSELAKLAIEDSTVKTKAAALANVAASTAVGDLAAAVDGFVTAFNAHAETASSVHTAADETNEIVTVPSGTKSATALITAINDCARMLDRHMRNDDGGGTNSMTAQPHASDDNRPDLVNAVVVKAASDMAGARALFADLHRAYEAHRVQIANPLVHEAADNTNTLSALSPLLQLDSAWLAAIAPTAPTAPATQNSGAVVLVAAAGGRIAT